MAGSRSHSQKLRNFLNSPLAGRDLEDIPGIGEVTAENMRRHGIKDAKMLFGEFLACRTPTKFYDEVQSHGANKGQAEMVYEALKAYDRQFN